MSTESIDYEPIDDNYITDMNVPSYNDYSSDPISRSYVTIGSFYLVGFVLTLKLILWS